MEKPLISVIIPTYKNRGGLKESVDSVLKQTISDIEIIVVDDNGKGTAAQLSTESLMRQYEYDESVKYIVHTVNKNGAATRNTGIRASRGEYIAFLDDDDIFRPKKLERQLEFLKDNPSYDCVYCKAVNHGKEQKISSLDTGDLTKKLLLGQTFMYTPTLMFTRKSIISINGFDESFRRHQDYELMLRFFHKGYKIGVINEPLTILGYNNGENIPNGIRMEQLKEYFLSKFDSYILNIETKNKGFRNKVLAYHYSAVFISYLKCRKIKDATRILFHYFPKSPKYFFQPLMRSLKAHIFR